MAGKTEFDANLTKRTTPFHATATRVLGVGVVQSSVLSSGLLSIALLSVSAITTSTTAEAAVFKCVDASGAVSYTQTPCVGADETQKVLASNTPKAADVDCRIANNFARRTAMSMRSGQSSGDLFSSYGGIDAIPRTAVGVINYVYSHKDNVNTGPQRITALSAARCSGGSYGSVTCDDFPYNFIAELGGCEAASMSTMTKLMPKAVPTEQASAVAGTPALGVRTASGMPNTKEACKQAAESKLTALFEQMRSGSSASNQQNLQNQKNDIREQLSKC